ncbi:hypothetical protein [Nonomuraea sp. NPDC002799]
MPASIRLGALQEDGLYGLRLGLIQVDESALTFDLADKLLAGCLLNGQLLSQFVHELGGFDKGLAGGGERRIDRAYAGTQVLVEIMAPYSAGAPVEQSVEPQKSQAERSGGGQGLGSGKYADRDQEHERDDDERGKIPMQPRKSCAEGATSGRRRSLSPWWMEQAGVRHPFIASRSQDTTHRFRTYSKSP